MAGRYIRNEAENLNYDFNRQHAVWMASMKFIRYGKYVGEPADAVDLEELIKRLGDFLLQSGFESQFYGVSQMDSERSIEALRAAILRAFQHGDLLPEGVMSTALR